VVAGAFDVRGAHPVGVSGALVEFGGHGERCLHGQWGQGVEQQLPDALVEVEPQKERLLRNTRQFVEGFGANNVLLTGARGTGKSSLIKACLNEFAPQGLRLIEVDKADLVDLPDIVDLVAERPERFIVFCDDLSFDEGEPGYKALKSILDGSVSQASDNVLIYATSNRRHLLPEYMKENLSYQHLENGEVHPGEVVEEKISLSERFGLWISFYPFSQAEYLAIVGQWLRHFGLADDAIAVLRGEALVWALERGSRSGRVAYQYARDRAGVQCDLLLDVLLEAGRVEANPVLPRWQRRYCVRA